LKSNLDIEKTLLIIDGSLHMGGKRYPLGNSLLRYTVLKILSKQEGMSYSELLTKISEVVRDPRAIPAINISIPSSLYGMEKNKWIKREHGMIKITDEGRELLAEMDLYLSRLKEVVG